MEPLSSPTERPLTAALAALYPTGVDVIESAVSSTPMLLSNHNFQISTLFAQFEPRAFQLPKLGCIQRLLVKLRFRVLQRQL